MKKVIKLNPDLIPNKFKRERQFNVIQSAIVLFAIGCGVFAFVYFIIIKP